MLGLIGTKKGMTRVFKEDGASIPVTVIEICKSKIVQRKTAEKDGYFAIQVTYGSKKNVSKSLAKKFTENKANTGYLTEFNLTEEEFNNLTEISEISLESIQSPSVVDVSGISKGKGFAGVVKRHNFKTQDATHGNSLSHRAPGSIGQCQFPGRVFKGKKMAGQMGNKKVTVQNLEIESIDTEDNILLVKGAIPGSIGSFIKILPSIKSNVNELFTIAEPTSIEEVVASEENLEAASENLKESDSNQEQLDAVSKDAEAETEVDLSDESAADAEPESEDKKGKEDA
jgi:large subunit ribosomal protein L3